MPKHPKPQRKCASLLLLCVFPAAISSSSDIVDANINSMDTYRVYSDPSTASGSSVPRNFLGFSTEVPAALAMMGATGNQSSFAQLLSNLLGNPSSSSSDASSASPNYDGPVLRIGGNSADLSCLLDPSQGPGAGNYSGCKYNISIKDFQVGDAGNNSCFIQCVITISVYALFVHVLLSFDIICFRRTITLPTTQPRT